jgi:hypothetical protein
VVAIGIAGSRPVGTIALEECDRGRLAGPNAAAPLGLGEGSGAARRLLAAAVA